MISTTLDLLRHGAVEGSLCLGNRHDVPLSPAGFDDMRGWTENLPPWQGVISSPLLRCRQFADEICHQYDLPLHVETGWRELGFGEWEGQNWETLYAKHGSRLVEFWRNPGLHPAPGGEHFSDFKQRLHAAWQRAQQLAHGQHWLIVTHAGPVRALLCETLGIPEQRIGQLDVPLAGLTRLEQFGDDAPRLLFHGRIA